MAKRKKPGKTNKLEKSFYTPPSPTIRSPVCYCCGSSHAPHDAPIEGTIFHSSFCDECVGFSYQGGRWHCPTHGWKDLPCTKPVRATTQGALL